MFLRLHVSQVEGYICATCALCEVADKRVTHTVQCQSSQHQYQYNLSSLSVVPGGTTLH